jgi:hypothetical protein
MAQHQTVPIHPRLGLDASGILEEAIPEKGTGRAMLAVPYSGSATG